MPPDSIIPELTRLLDDDDPSTRGSAAKALGELGEPARSSLPEFLRLLRSLNPRIRRDAAQAFESLGPIAESALPALLTALDDEDKQVQRYARNALDKVAPPRDLSTTSAVKSIRSLDANRRRQVAVDLARDPNPISETVDALQTLLHDDTPTVRATASAALGHLGGVARGTTIDLIEASDDSDPEVRIAVLRALAHVAPESTETLATLTAHLDDPEEPVRSAAITALGALGARANPAVPQLIAMLDNPKYDHDFTIYYHLGSIGLADGQTLPVLLDALDNPDSKIRMEATYALARIAAKGEAETIVPRLVPILHDEAESVRREAALGLGRAMPRSTAEATALDILELGSFPARKAVITSLQLMKPDSSGHVIPALLWALDDPAPDIREAAAMALGYRATEVQSAEDQLRRHLDDDNPSVRNSITRTLHFIDRARNRSQP